MSKLVPTVHVETIMDIVTGKADVGEVVKTWRSAPPPDHLAVSYRNLRQLSKDMHGVDKHCAGMSSIVIHGVEPLPVRALRWISKSTASLRVGAPHVEEDCEGSDKG